MDNLPKPWPFAPVERVEAIDGTKCRPPDWWKVGAGAWGCYRSHYRIIEDCLQQGTSSVLIFEDDAVFCKEFQEMAELYFEHLPTNWTWAYLGGQHIDIQNHQPEKIGDYVVRPKNVIRTHAYGIRSSTLTVLYRHLSPKNTDQLDHIDRMYGRLMSRRKIGVYCPNPWLIGQAENTSDIAHRHFDQRYWDKGSQAGLERG